jgi:hypothetical protein
MVQQGSKVQKDGVQIIQGTPLEPITRAALCLRLWRVKDKPGKPDRTRASLYMVRPAGADYVIKELIPDMELGPQAALDKTVAIAKRGDVDVVYLNPDLQSLPKPRRAARG